MIKPCITVKGKPYRHLVVYDGPGNGVHCIFCGNKWPTRAEAMKQFEVEQQWKQVSESIRWPE